MHEESPSRVINTCPEAHLFILFVQKLSGRIWDLMDSLKILGILNTVILWYFIICLQVLDNLLQVMKRKDRMFDKTYNRIGYTGSFYDRLKVGEADEYDLNLILKPKFKMEPIKVGFIFWLRVLPSCVASTIPYKLQIMTDEIKL